ncbi:hypothetical protein QYM18_12960 [Ectopseudomonas chengduensis]|nr:hypothetical protein [Pseudomonas chengduensis]WKC35390.1 hypothetical protein QYM18_12960 [Pseudomonas chengduensis]
MRLHSYIVARDYGFAPNPFHGVCTLACCKSRIRKSALVGDYIVGLTPRNQGNKICYAMEVTSKMSFDDYWVNPDYQIKKPVFNRSYKFAVGDNIYYRKDDNSWHQQNSHHTHEDGSPIQENIDTDTGWTDQILISDNFSYWGNEAIELPAQFNALRVTRGHKNDFSHEFVGSFIAWFRNMPKGLLAVPERWAHPGTFR